MKIFQVIASIKKSAGGPSYSVPKLCSNIANNHRAIELLVSDATKPETHFDFQVSTFPTIGPEKLGFSPQMNSYLNERLTGSDMVHIQGIWLASNIMPGFIAKSKKAKLLISPRGMLSSWSLRQSKIKKAISSIAGQKKVIHFADCLHATADSEYEDIRNYGYRGPIAIIPNGVDIPLTKNSKQLDSQVTRKVIFISRIHPKKGIEILLKAWERIESSFPDTELLVCGPGESPYLENIIEEINKYSERRVKYLNPLYGDKKQAFYQSASLFVLPTHSENFGLVVAEALSHSTPTIVSKGAPWEGLITHNCGWWIDNTIDDLTSAMSEALSLPDSALRSMGENGREWISNEFSWPTIGDKMLQTYRWLNNEIDKPNFIKVD